MDGRPNLRLYNVILDVQVTRFGPKSLYEKKKNKKKIVDFFSFLIFQVTTEQQKLAKLKQNRMTSHVFARRSKKALDKGQS